jgi:hypothetical protein
LLASPDALADIGPSRVPGGLERLPRQSLDRALLNRVDHLDLVTDEPEGRNEVPRKVRRTLEVRQVEAVELKANRPRLAEVPLQRVPGLLLRAGLLRVKDDAEVGTRRLRQREGLAPAAEERHGQAREVEEHESKRFAQPEQHRLRELAPSRAQQRAGRDGFTVDAHEWLWSARPWVRGP